ncbi:DUF2628 domain-containing protein, partial [Paenisporosarcina sp.]|uniref:DUF2628 domain-containing protein n=1 Tax=Paenisporosarcina sp. TaxID=1932001 RepID=UPI003C7631F5
MYCSNCGLKLNSEANFCGNCGREVAEKSDQPIINVAPGKQVMQPNLQEDVGASSNTTNVDNLKDEDHLLKLFVGEKKENYFLNQWSKGLYSWNWSAFFLGIFWLGYRKMFRPIFILMAVFLVIDLVVALLGIEVAYLDGAISLVVGITLGIWGNHLYHQHAVRNIDILKKKFKDNDVLEKQISMRGNGSWKGFWASFGILFCYVILLMVIITFVPPIMQTSETSQVNAIVNTSNEEDLDSDIETEITELLRENIISLEDEDTEGYLSMIYKSSDESIYADTLQILDETFNLYDLKYDISDIEFISISNHEVKVRVTQTTKQVNGVDGKIFRDNESIIIHTLIKQSGNWTFFESEVESVSYFDEVSLTQTAKDSPTNAFNIKAPSMFDFSITEDIDVDNDGVLDKVTFQGGPENGDSYLNENVELIVEFNHGGSTPITLMAENYPAVYFYDIDQDGWMEVFYETGYRVTSVDMYQFTPDGLEYSTSLSGSIVEFTNDEVITSDDVYPYDEFKKFSFTSKEDESAESDSSYDSAETTDMGIEDESLSLDIYLDDFLSQFSASYTDYLLKVGSNASIYDYELISNHGGFQWILHEDIMLFGSYDSDEQLEWVSVTSDISIPKGIEEAAEI